MSIPVTLLNNDARAFKAWFATQTLSKVFVLSGFIGVFGTIAYFLYTGTGYFFNTLYPLQAYGLLTAGYIIKAVVLLIFFLGTGSSVATTFGLFFSRNKNYFYLMALPVKPAEIIKWQFGKLIFTNFIFLSIFLLPLIMAYGFAFKLINILFVSETLFLLLTLTCTTVCLGGMTALLIVKNIKKPNIYLNLLGVLTFFMVIAAVFNLIFPARMELLSKADPNSFFRIYYSLPLNNNLIPTNWLAMSLTGNQTTIWLTIIFTGILAVPYLILMEKNFLREVQEMSARALAPEFIHKLPEGNLFHFEKFSGLDALALKDLAGLIRSPAEAGYGIFLLLLMTFFFFLFSKINLNQEMDPVWIKNLIIFSYSGFVFFANTYLLRLVFPPMAAESEAAWYLFSLPLSKEQILQSKMVLTFVVGLPLFLLSMFVWWGLKFTFPYQTVLALSSFWTVLVLLVTLTFLGAIHPNFAEGSSPERVSTSSMGIAALVISTVITSVFSLSLYKFLNGEINTATVAAIQLIMGIISIILLFLVSKSAVKKYEF